MSDYYARRLAEIQGAPPAQNPQGPQYPPTAPPLQPGQLPPHLAPYAAQPVPGNGQYGPAGTPAAPPQQQPGQQFYSYNAETGAQTADDGTIALLYNSAAQTGGSQKVREASSPCPQCAHGTLMAREYAENGMKLRIPMMPQCTHCNYPVVQSGSQGGSASSARSSGAARPARQLPSNHRVSVMTEAGMQTFDPPTSGR